MAKAGKNNYVLNLRHHTSLKVSGSESSEVGSDEEYESLSAPENMAMSMDDPLADAGWCRIGERVPTMMENTEGRPHWDVVEVDVVVEEYPGAGRIKGRGCSAYMQLLKVDEHVGQRDVAGLWYPFSCREEWQVFRWLSSLRVPMSKVNEFFNLDYVSTLLLETEL